MSPEIVARPSLRLRGLRLINRIVQWASLFFLGEWALYGAFRCPFVVPFVSCQNCPVITCPGQLSRLFWGFWGVWLAAALLLGRAFCGWVCPGGLVNRVLSCHPFRIKMPVDRALVFAWGKVLLLVLSLWIWFVLGQPRVNVPIRVGEFWPAMLLTYEHAFPAWQLRFGILVALLALGIVLPMAWCRFACPLGGLLELVNRWAPLRFYKTDACNDCGQCRRACPMETRPGETNCTNCGDCLHSCPQECIRFGRTPGKKS